MTALFIGIYGAALSTILAIVTLYRFWSDHRTIHVAKSMSYSSSDEASYTFVVTNVSSRPVTIIDCMSWSLAKTPKDGLQPDWGVQTDKIERLFGGESAEPFRPPFVIAPGGVLLLNLDSSTLIDTYADYARSDVMIEAKSDWTPTDKAVLEIYHSLAQKAVSVRFALEKDEARKGQAIGRRIASLRKDRS